MRLPREIAAVVAMARVSNWNIEAVTPNGIALQLPDGGHLLVMRCTGPMGPAGWRVVATISAPSLPMNGAFDLASWFAGLLASGTVWPLHEVVDGTPHLVDAGAP